ncbi:heterokaryon incompatibility protein-domain-containing protein [Aspergillus granulosus]|uniref:Heterokaryon incompatibility protein-domain-containing protein n=1 Tax=Aspergillus granulosus TaxID=176169 RepID=A0ABR4HB77_9EURO
MPGKQRFTDRLRRIFMSERKPPSQPPSQTRPVEQSQEPVNEPSGVSSSNVKPTQADEDKFPDISPALITNYRGHWCCFDYTDDDEESALVGVGSPPPNDFDNETRRKWGSHATFAPEFLGAKIFAPNWMPDAEYRLPTFLYDLVARRVIETSTLSEPEKTRYATISHVWGDSGIELDGTPYGVPGPIPIRNEEKLIQILEAARILVGERYIWMDILCLNRGFPYSSMRQAEVADMGRYFRNATGCFVWLDDAFEDCGSAWAEDVLDSLAGINALFKLDRQGMSTSPASEASDVLGLRGAGVTTQEMGGAEARECIRKVRKVEQAPWFRRVWTLQEAVIPKDFLICTPEHYMISCSMLLQSVAMVDVTARRLLKEGAMEGVEIIQELHGSEVYKILKLRQLYQNGEVGFWHIAQAVRSRSCTIENDRVIGVSGMLQRTYPVFDHRMELESLWDETWEQAILESDFSALLYLGERPSMFSMFADAVSGMPFISIGGKPNSPPKETHRLKLVDGIAMKDVGCDHVRDVTGIMCTILEGPLAEWANTQPGFADWGMKTHQAFATAWGLPAHTESIKRKNGEIADHSPGAYAAYLSLAPSYATPMLGRLENETFSRNVKRLLPRALLRRLRILHLLLGVNHGKHAVVLLQMANSEPQVGIISEPPDETVIALTPSSYHDRPGPGCLLVKVLEDGVFHKIGIGLGKAVKADSFVSGQIIPPPRLPGPWVYASSIERPKQGSFAV